MVKNISLLIAGAVLGVTALHIAFVLICRHVLGYIH